MSFCRFEFCFIFSQRLPWWQQPSYPHVITVLSPKSRGSLWSETRIHANGALDRRWETFREITMLIGEIGVYMYFKKSCISGQSEENDDPKRTSRQTWQTERQHPRRLERGLRRLQVHLHLSRYLMLLMKITNISQIFIFKTTAATTIGQINCAFSNQEHKGVCQLWWNLKLCKVNIKCVLSWSKSWKNKLSNAGGVSTGGAETTPTHGKTAVSLNSLPLVAYLIMVFYSSETSRE